MSDMLRTQENVPEVYVGKSRDFQLLCRLYDSVLNGCKFDSDTMKYLTDTSLCNARLLSLLQTKLGFFSKKDITDDDLRYVLQAFPYILSHKGSLTAIKQAVYMFLKLNHINASILINVYGKESTVFPYTVVIGINTGFRDTTLLDEVLKYVLPTGYTIEYSFYSPTGVNTNLELESSPKIHFVQDALNSNVVSSDIDEADDINILGNVGTAEVISSVSPYILGYWDGDTRQFYYDSAHSKLIIAVAGVRYKDLLENKIYEYDGTQYNEVEVSNDEQE